MVIAPDGMYCHCIVAFRPQSMAFTRFKQGFKLGLFAKLQILILHSGFAGVQALAPERPGCHTSGCCHGSLCSQHHQWSGQYTS